MLSNRWSTYLLLRGTLLLCWS